MCSKNKNNNKKKTVIASPPFAPTDLCQVLPVILKFLLIVNIKITLFQSSQS